MFEILPEVLTTFARGGGGGSGGSSGGGGDLFALIGYFPSYYAGKFIKKYLPRKAELAVSITTASIMTVILLSMGAAFNGGFFFMCLIVAGIWLGWYAAFFGAWEKIKKQAKQAKKTIDVAAQSDTAWDEHRLKEHVSNVFLQYQQDWSTSNSEGIRTYTTYDMHVRTHLLLYALHQMHRTNSMSNTRILGMEIIFAHDNDDNTKDSFKMAISAQAHDVLNDQRTSKILFTDDREFIEYWTFVRSGDTWLLDKIDQATANASLGNLTIEQFARSNAMYYSIDMGWLLLPNRGVLFKGGKFGISDINNHVVGMYNKQLIQLYNYKETDKSNMIVTQINLPKSYDGIIIQPKQSIFSSVFSGGTPSGYTQYTFEWPDFNKRYRVSATNQDRLAAFELVNPGFMAYLYDTDPGVSIEVADNVVYLYKKVKDGPGQDVSPEDFKILFTILEKAFKELKL